MSGDIIRDPLKIPGLRGVGPFDDPGQTQAVPAVRGEELHAGVDTLPSLEHVGPMAVHRYRQDSGEYPAEPLPPLPPEE